MKFMQFLVAVHVLSWFCPNLPYLTYVKNSFIVGRETVLNESEITKEFENELNDFLQVYSVSKSIKLL